MVKLKFKMEVELDLSNLSEDQKQNLVNESTDDIKALNIEMLNLSLKLKKMDSSKTKEIKEIKEIQMNVQDKINANNKILQLLQPAVNSSSGNVFNQSNSVLNIKSKVKIPQNLDKFDPNSDVSDVYLDYIYSKSLSVGFSETNGSVGLTILVIYIGTSN